MMTVYTLQTPLDGKVLPVHRGATSLLKKVEVKNKAYAFLVEIFAVEKKNIIFPKNSKNYFWAQNCRKKFYLYHRQVGVLVYYNICHEIWGQIEGCLCLAKNTRFLGPCTWQPITFSYWIFQDLASMYWIAFFWPYKVIKCGFFIGLSLGHQNYHQSQLKQGRTFTWPILLGIGIDVLAANFFLQNAFRLILPTFLIFFNAWVDC